MSKFVLLSSLLTNGAAKGQTLNPSFLVLNIFGGVLSKKHEVRGACRLRVRAQLLTPGCRQSSTSGRAAWTGRL